MLVNMKEMLADAEKNNGAVYCINTPNFDILRAVVDAAEEVNAPVIIAHASAHDKEMPMELIGPLMAEYAKKSEAPVCVHLDHGTGMEYMLRAIKNGFTSMMYDCSALPYEENVRELQYLTKLAHPLGYTRA
jgi:fructose-bisphosphate aldolase class II